MRFILALCLTMLFFNTLQANTGILEEEKKSVKVGYQYLDNSKQKKEAYIGDVRLDNILKYRGYVYSIRAKAGYEKTNGETLNNLYYVSLLSEYNLNYHNLWVYGKVSTEKDIVNGINNRTKIGFGLLHHLVNNKYLLIKERIGLQQEFTSYVENENTLPDSNTNLLLGFKVIGQIAENIKLKCKTDFIQDISDERDNYKIDVDAKFVFKVQKHFNIESGYEYKYFNIPATDASKSDKKFVTYLVFTF